MACKDCLYNKVCELWRAQECQDANSVLTGGLGDCPLYISAANVVIATNDYVKHLPKTKAIWVGRGDGLPPKEFVPVVRCKGCKHWRYIDVFNSHECDIFGGAYETVGYPTKPDDYCSYGERREQE